MPRYADIDKVKEGAGKEYIMSLDGTVCYGERRRDLKFLDRYEEKDLTILTKEDVRQIVANCDEIADVAAISFESKYFNSSAATVIYKCLLDIERLINYKEDSEDGNN